MTSLELLATIIVSGTLAALALAVNRMLRVMDCVADSYKHHN